LIIEVFDNLGYQRSKAHVVKRERLRFSSSRLKVSKFQ